MRSTLRSTTGLIATWLLALAMAHSEISLAAETYVAGKHYQLLEQPVPTSDPERIEVTEIFWYGCSHCYDFEALLEPWAEKLSGDVVFVRNPAVWHPTMELHSRAYYTAKVMGLLDTLHPVIFKEINVEKNKLASEEALAELFVAHGADEEKFHKTFNSFGVSSAVRQAQARQRGYQVKATPEMVVNGKYRITSRLAGSHADMLEIAAYLVAKERENLSSTEDS